MAHVRSLYIYIYLYKILKYINYITNIELFFCRKCFLIQNIIITYSHVEKGKEQKQ